MINTYCSASGMFTEKKNCDVDARGRKLVSGFQVRLQISDNPYWHYCK